jgi:hypothetical protein
MFFWFWNLYQAKDSGSPDLHSKDLLQSSTWPVLSANAYERLHATIVKVYRSICMQQFCGDHDMDGIFNNDELINEFNLMIPFNIVRLSRIMLLCRAICKNPLVLVQWIKGSASFEGSWAHTVHQDMKWCCFSPCFEQCSAFSFDDWFKQMKCGSPWSRIPKAFRMFLKSPFVSISVVTTMWSWHLCFATSHVICALALFQQASPRFAQIQIHEINVSIRQYADGGIPPFVCAC